MASDFDSFDASPLGAFIQSALGDRGSQTAEEATGNVFFAGNFTSLGGVACTDSAYWDNISATFKTLSSGAGISYALALFRDALYLLRSDGAIQALNTTGTPAWETHDSTNVLSATVGNDLAADDNYLIAVGDTLKIGGAGTYSVCRFNGISWSDISPVGITNVISICIANDGEYVVLAFGGATTTIYKGNGASWTQSIWEIDSDGAKVKNINGSIVIANHNSADTKYRLISGPGAWNYINSVFVWDYNDDTITGIGDYISDGLINAYDVDKAGTNWVVSGLNLTNQALSANSRDAAYLDGNTWLVFDQSVWTSTQSNLTYRLKDRTVLVGVQGTNFEGITGQNLYQINTDLTVQLFHSATCNGQIYDALDIGETTLIGQFKFSNITNNYGWDEGGESRTINGGGFTVNTTATWDGSPITVNFVSQAQLTLTTPAHAAGAINVVLTESGATKTQTFTYRHLTISSVSPTSGTTAGGTSVTVNGTWLSGSTLVYFGGTIATNIVYNSKAGTITCDTPAHSAGAVDVLITDGVASDTLAAAYTYT